MSTQEIPDLPDVLDEGVALQTRNLFYHNSQRATQPSQTTTADGSDSGSGSEGDEVEEIIGKILGDDGSIHFEVVYVDEVEVVSPGGTRTTTKRQWRAEHDLKCPELIKAYEDSDNDSRPETSSIHPAVQGTPYAKAREDGYHGTIVELWDREMLRAKRRSLKGMEYEDFRYYSLAILASLPRSLYEEIICGNIQRKKYVDRDFRVALDNYQVEYSHVQGKRPAIYIFEFVDNKGYSPTIGDAHSILDDMERYKDDWKFAMEIDGDQSDNADDPDSLEDPAVREQNYKEGFRQFLKLEKHRTVLTEFLLTVRTYLHDLSLSPTDRMPRPFREVGYTWDQNARIMAHSNWQSSNYLMNLMELISVAKYDQRWRMRGETIFHCFDPPQAWIGETIFTALSGADVPSGHGLSHFQPGISVNTVKKITDDRTWRSWIDEIMQGHTLTLNLEDEKVRIGQLEKEKLNAEDIEKMADQKKIELTALEIETKEAEIRLKKAYLGAKQGKSATSGGMKRGHTT